MSKASKLMPLTRLRFKQFELDLPLMYCDQAKSYFYASFSISYVSDLTL